MDKYNVIAEQENSTVMSHYGKVFANKLALS